MQTIKVDREAYNLFREFQGMRENKNSYERGEKNYKEKLKAKIDLSEPCAFMFDGQVIATQTESFRSGVDLEKLAKSYPKAFADCQMSNRVLTLKVTI